MDGSAHAIVLGEGVMGEDGDGITENNSGEGTPGPN